MPNKPISYAVGGLASTTASFSLMGGEYGITHAGVWNGGTVTLNTLAFDGSTWVGIAAGWTSNGYSTATIPEGDYQLAVSGGTAAVSTFVSISRLPRQ